MAVLEQGREVWFRETVSVFSFAAVCSGSGKREFEGCVEDLSWHLSFWVVVLDVKMIRMPHST